MCHTRRAFLKNSLKGAFLLSGGQWLQACQINPHHLPPAKHVKLRFAIASDGHYGQANTPFDLHHSQMIQWLNREKDGRGIDFTFINGDIYHDDHTHSETVKKVWDTLKMPYYVSHGNHDHGPEAYWKQTWGYGWEHQFSFKGCGFITLNTSDEKGDFICIDPDNVQSIFHRFDYHEHLFVFMHISPITWAEDTYRCEQLALRLRNQVNLKAVFLGHDHDEDSFKEKQGQYYFYDGHIGGDWGIDYTGYRIVEVMHNGNILTYQVNPAIDRQMNSLYIT